MNNNTCFFFDLDDTLIDYEAAFEQASFFVFSKMHPECDVRKWFRMFKFYCDEYWNLLENGKVSRTLYQKMRYEQALNDLGLAASQGESEVFHGSLAKVIPRFCVPFSWSCKLLSYFIESDIAWGIISNGYSSVQRSKLKVLPVKVEESLLFISEETGFEKPDVRYFHFVQEKTGFSNPVYVGNSYEQDVAPAAAAGWKTIWLNSSHGGVTAVTVEMAKACFIM